MSEHQTAYELERRFGLIRSRHELWEVARDAIAALRAAEEDAEVGRLLRELRPEWDFYAVGLRSWRETPDTEVTGEVLPEWTLIAWEDEESAQEYHGPTPLAALRALKDALER